ncbi:MAG: methionyl-tRNA formyltransferase [Solirubrobacteraceae bacterium]|nr:methionyl-tRNA formyltransferase [Solirubrobacteraceae bacterium]
MRTVYLGTSDFAVTILDRLADSPHRPTLVVTRPDRPAGRGRKLQSPPVADAARALGIPVAQPDRLADDEPTQHVLAEEPDALIVCAYGAIVREPLLSARTIYNVHPSLLPRWRGAAPIERAIAAGDTETGVSIMALEEGLDSGPVAIQQAEPIHPDDTYGTLAPRLADLGAELLIRALDEQPPFIAQPEDGITYAEKITADDRTLDPSAPAAASALMVRALSPHIGTRIALDDGSMLGVHEARVIEGVADDDQLHVADGVARLGALELLRVQPPGGKPMAAADWLRGRQGASR